MSVCPAKKHLFSLQETTPEEYREDDGVKLVDAWMQAYTARQEATRTSQAEMERLQAALVNFARVHGLEVIVGTDHKLRVKPRSGLKVPVRSEDPAAYEALLERLRELGVYASVTTLDRHAVIRLLEGGDLSEEARRRLAERLVPDEGVRITPSRLTDRERPFEP
jgi:hypothetical protein